MHVRYDTSGTAGPIATIGDASAALLDPTALVTNSPIFGQTTEDADDKKPSALARMFMSAESKLKLELVRNPFFPFLRVEVPRSDHNDDADSFGQAKGNARHVLELRVRYRIFYAAVTGLVICAAVLAFFFAGKLQSNGFFVFPIIGVVVCGTAIFNYKDTRVYTLDPETCTYAFALGGRVVTRDSYYNVYIRLRRDVRSGGSLGSAQRTYHLVFNGFGIDARRLSASSRHASELRALGQRIAATLNLNYFDEANTSPHHVVRHFRSDRSLFSFANPMSNAYANTLGAHSRSASMVQLASSGEPRTSQRHLAGNVKGNTATPGKGDGKPKGNSREASPSAPSTQSQRGNYLGVYQGPSKIVGSAVYE